MHTQGYERSTPWRLALALMTRVAALTDTFEDDGFSMAGKLKVLAADLPARCAMTHEQADYDSAQRHAQSTSEHLLKLWMTAQVAAHLGLIHPKPLAALRKQLDAIDDATAALPDELFEDDGEGELADAA